MLLLIAVLAGLSYISDQSAALHGGAHIFSAPHAGASPSVQPSGEWVRDPVKCAPSSPGAVSCTPSGYTWNRAAAHVQGAAACELLSRGGVRRIFFVGDSFMRHAWQVFLMLLSEDFEFGGTQGGAACAGPMQLEEKSCRTAAPYQSNGLCGGSVTGQLYYGAWPLLGKDAIENWKTLDGNGTVIVWSIGAHPTAGNYETRAGVNNASDFFKHAVEPVCDAEPHPLHFMPQTRGVQPRVLWLSQHCRVRWTWPDETNERILDFNARVTASLLEHCHVETIDTSESTCALVRQRPDDAKNMTWDGVHWQIAVNVLKVVSLLHKLGDDLSSGG